MDSEQDGWSLPSFRYDTEMYQNFENKWQVLPDRKKGYK